MECSGFEQHYESAELNVLSLRLCNTHLSKFPCSKSNEPLKYLQNTTHNA